MCGSGAYVLAMTETSVTNPFTTGVVDIKLNEYQMSDGEEIPYEDVKDILPGQTISKIPRIHNFGNDCYVRAKVTMEGTEETIRIENMDERWKMSKDGYFYYQEILPTGAETDIFQQVTIPTDFSQEVEGKAFDLKIDVDAVQSKNFAPDFEADSPWGPVEIQKCIKEGQYDIRTFQAADNQPLRVVYQGDSKSLMSEPEDFFHNFPVLMPGDEFTDAADLTNNSGDAIDLYFRSEAEDDKLLEKIQLQITAEIDGKAQEVYSGPIRAKELADNKLLGSLPAESTGRFQFKVSVPPELDNEYTVLADQVTWFFSTEPVKDELIKIQTGDARMTGYLLILSGITLGIGILIYRKTNY